MAQGQWVGRLGADPAAAGPQEAEACGRGFQGSGWSGQPVGAPAQAARPTRFTSSSGRSDHVAQVSTSCR